MTSPTLAPMPDFTRFLSDVPFTFPCPRCGNEFKQTLGWFESNDKIVCPACKETVVFDAKQLRNAMDAVRQGLIALWMSTAYVV